MENKTSHSDNSSIDLLLAMPLAQIDDNGFSQRVLNELKAYQRKRMLFLVLIPFALSIVLVAIFPVNQWLSGTAQVILSYGDTYSSFAAIVGETMNRLTSLMNTLAQSSTSIMAFTSLIIMGLIMKLE